MSVLIAMGITWECPRPTEICMRYHPIEDFFFAKKTMLNSHFTQPQHHLKQLLTHMFLTHVLPMTSRTTRSSVSPILLITSQIP